MILNIIKHDRIPPNITHFVTLVSIMASPWLCRAQIKTIFILWTLHSGRARRGINLHKGGINIVDSEAFGLCIVTCLVLSMYGGRSICTLFLMSILLQCLLFIFTKINLIVPRRVPKIHTYIPVPRSFMHGSFKQTSWH